ncbi:MAG TPA: phosphate ABC transporter permease subunit PstC [Candidatus Dormibacteraeota bacterium]|jgi:phosphate transport system permease protein|nr:phosphate ABC transporter permease subunit PstC [Candidatus Dormibacteraeota bacterium]
MSVTKEVQDSRDGQLQKFSDRITAATSDQLFEILSTVFACSIIVTIALTVVILGRGSLLVFEQFGFGFVTGVNWNAIVGKESYGILPYILGTLVTSGIAIGIGIPISLGIAIFLAEMAPNRIRAPLSQLVELLAAVPSVVYGLWGLFVLRFWIANYVEAPLSTSLGFLPIFQGAPNGLDLLMGGVILSIMIIPTISAISRDVMSAVPSSQREAAYSIGATRWEVVRIGVLSYARSGIFGAAILGLGRAVGETMAVTMVIGNSTGVGALPVSLFRSGQTMASLIANEFNEAEAGSLQQSALIGVGFMLFLIALLINMFAQLMVWRVLKVKGGAVE